FLPYADDSSPTVLFALSLHDALPISTQLRSGQAQRGSCRARRDRPCGNSRHMLLKPDTPPAPSTYERVRHQTRKYRDPRAGRSRSEEHTSELQSQSISYAVFCLKKKKRCSTSTRSAASSCVSRGCTSRSSATCSTRASRARSRRRCG